jgi:hypothetical protein
MKTAVCATPRPATALPIAADATPAMTSVLPTGRRRIVSNATATTASVPSEFATIATTRSGKRSRCCCASGMLVPETGDVSVEATPIPTAKPA